MKGELLEIWGDPNYPKDMVHVYDFSQEFCLAILADRDKCSYSMDIPVTLEEQVCTIADVFNPEGKKSEIVYRPKLPVGGGFLVGVRNAKDELGYEPRYDSRSLFEELRGRDGGEPLWVAPTGR